MNATIFKKLLQEGVITQEQFSCIEAGEKRPLSVHWELRTLLYLGIVLLTGALGIFVYENIDTIGHHVILLCIALAAAGCFTYCFKKGGGFTSKKVTSPNVLFDYILLLGCLLLLIFTGYLQFEYHVFGDRWGLSAFIPMVILFFLAYYFDHLGVLSLAITNLAAWAGITITPVDVLEENDFGDARIIYTGIALGVVLTAFSFFTKLKQLKTHFAFTYENFGMNILMIALLAGMFYFEQVYLLWFLVVIGVGVFFFMQAVKEKSFYFLVMTLLYGYIAISYVVIRILVIGDGVVALYLGIMYFIASGILLIRFLMKYNKKLKADESLPEQRPAQ